MNSILNILFTCPLTTDSSHLHNCPSNLIFVDKLHGQVTSSLIPSHQANYPILLHCVHGKDRTGIVTALIQLVCGVDDENIIKGYVASRAALVDAIRAGKITQTHPMYLDEHLISSSSDDISKGVFGFLREQQLSDDLHAAAEHYLLMHGMTQAELEAIRRNLVT